MLISAIVSVFIVLMQVIVGWFDVVTLADLPFIGDTVRGFLITMVTTWNAFLVTFPYAVLPWQLFLYGVIPLEITIIILRFILGSRTPVSHN